MRRFDWHRMLVGAFAVLSFGCGKAGLSGTDGSAWRELRTKHFVMHTELDEDDAAEAINTFEKQYDLLSSMIFDTDEPPEYSTRVVIFESEQGYRKFGPPLSGGYYTTRIPGELESQPTMVLFGEPTMINRVSFLHELAHRFLVTAMGNMPVWLGEGLAEYYSTITVDGDKAVLGNDVPSFGFVMRPEWEVVRHSSHDQIMIPVPRLPRPSDLMQMSHVDFYGDPANKAEAYEGDLVRLQFANYGAAWSLVHLLKNGPESYRDVYERAMNAIAEGKSAAQAFSDVLEGVSKAELDEAWLEHLNRRGTTLWRTDYSEPPDVKPDLRTMSPAAAHLLLARLGPRENPKAEILKLIEQARATHERDAECNAVEAAYRLRAGEKIEARQLFEQAVAEAGEKPEYLHGIVASYTAADDADALGQQVEAPEALMKAVKQLASSATTAGQFNSVAWAYALTGHAKEGVAPAEQSLRLDPNCWECFDTYGRVLAELGEFNAAAESQELAIGRLPDRAPSKLRKSLEDKLQQYRTKLRD